MTDILDAAGEPVGPGRRRRPGRGRRAARRRRGSSVDHGGASAQRRRWPAATSTWPQITRLLAEQGLYVRRAGAGPARPGVGLPGAHRRGAPRRQPGPTERRRSARSRRGDRDDPAAPGGDPPAAQPSVHPDRRSWCCWPLGAFQLAVNDALAPPTAAEQAAAQQAYEEARPGLGGPTSRTVRRTPASRPRLPLCRTAAGRLHRSAEPFDEVAARVAAGVDLPGRRWRALMVAGSFIGAEYSTGSIANWLSFIPRRGRCSPPS